MKKSIIIKLFFVLLTLSLFMSFTLSTFASVGNVTLESAIADESGWTFDNVNATFQDGKLTLEATDWAGVAAYKLGAGAADKFLAFTIKNSDFPEAQEHVFSFSLRHSTTGFAWNTGANAYLVWNKPDKMELQVFTSGAGNIIYEDKVAANEPSEEYLIRFGAFTSGDDTTLILEVDGVIVYEHVAEGSNFDSDSYFVIYPMQNNPITLGVPELETDEEEQTTDTTAPGDVGIISFGILSVISSGALILLKKKK